MAEMELSITTQADSKTYSTLPVLNRSTGVTLHYYNNAIYAVYYEDGTDPNYGVYFGTIHKLDLNNTATGFVEVQPCYWRGGFGSACFYNDLCFFFAYKVEGGYNRGWFFVYNISNDALSDTNIPNLPTNDGSITPGNGWYLPDSGSVVCNGYIYIVGGRGNTYYSNRISRLPVNSLTAAWESRLRPTSWWANYHAAVAVDNRYIYCFGGNRYTSETSTDYPTNKVVMYDTVLNTFTEDALPPTIGTQYGRGTICVGDAVFYTQNITGCQYLDLRKSNKDWVNLPQIPHNAQFALIYVPPYNQIWAFKQTSISGLISTDFFTLQLDSNFLPTGTAWNQANGNYGIISPIVLSSIDFTVSTTLTDNSINQTGSASLGSATTTIALTKVDSHTLYFAELTSKYSILISGITGAIGDVSLALDDNVEFSDGIALGVGIAFNQDTTLAASGILFTDTSGDMVTTLTDDIKIVAVTGVLGTLSLNNITQVLVGLPMIEGVLDTNVDVDITSVGGQFATGTLLETLRTTFNALATIKGSASDLGDLTKQTTTISMNTKTFGVSEYDNYNFNSYFTIAGVDYACCSTGMYTLGGDYDDDQQIISLVKTGVSDFASPKLKSIPDAYLHLRSSGSIIFRLIADEQTDRAGYVLNYDGYDGVHRRRVKLARGIRATNWQVELTNPDGLDFDIKQLELPAKELNRVIR